MTGRSVFSPLAAAAVIAVAARVVSTQTRPWMNPDSSKTEAPVQPRKPLVRVVTISQAGITTQVQRERIAATLETLDQAASFHPDIVCLPEYFSAKDEIEPLSGPTSGLLGKWAADHSCYVICPLKVRVGQRVHSSAVLLDRRGQIAGRYDCTHITEDEIHKGTSPGAVEPPVFQTDFGTIGIQVCFDMNWRDSWQRLKEKGAKIIFWASTYPAPRQASGLAWMNACYVAGATRDGSAAVYDVSGRPLAASGTYQHWAAATLPIDKKSFEVDYNVKGARAAQQKYGDKIELVWSHDEDWFTLATLDPALSMETIKKEFGLTAIGDYIPRAQKLQDQVRGKTLEELKEFNSRAASGPR